MTDEYLEKVAKSNVSFSVSRPLACTNKRPPNQHNTTQVYNTTQKPPQLKRRYYPHLSHQYKYTHSGVC